MSGSDLKRFVWGVRILENDLKKFGENVIPIGKNKEHLHRCMIDTAKQIYNLVARYKNNVMGQAENFSSKRKVRSISEYR